MVSRILKYGWQTKILKMKHIKMSPYSVQPRDWIFVTGHVFLSFAKSLSENIGKNISKNLSSKYNEKTLDHAKHAKLMHLKLHQKEWFKR